MAAAEVSKPPRFMTLSLPKPPPLGFLPDRRSVYWDNGIPPKDYTKQTKYVQLSGRLEELAKSKQTHPNYVPQRFSPVWHPSPYTLHAKITPRVEVLAHPKQCHPNYRPSRIVTTTVPTAVLLFNPSSRLCQLAKPKEHPPSPHAKLDDADWQIWTQRELKIPLASQRVQVLADPKQLHEKYVPPRGVQWDISKEALSSVASERVVKLARPKSKHLDTEDYNPQAWVVSNAALLAQPSPRINELATPLPRKVRTKKLG